MSCNMRKILLKIISCLILVVALSNGFRPRSARHKNCSRHIFIPHKEINKNKQETQVLDTYDLYNKTDIAERRYRRSEEEDEEDTHSLEEKVTGIMNTSHNSYTKKEGELVEFMCNNAATKSMFKYNPKSKRRWLFNNNALQLEGGRMMLQLGILVIQALSPKDQGVYLCRIEYEEGKTTTVDFFSLVVESQIISIRVKETLDLHVQCNSNPIGDLLPSAKREWKRNGTVMKSDIDADDYRSDVFPNANLTHEGYWLCSVSHSESNRIWKTALYRVFIDDPPTVLERIVMYINDKPYVAVIVLSVIVALFFVFLARVAKNAEEELDVQQQQFDSFKERLIEMYGDKENLSGSENDKSSSTEYNDESDESDKMQRFSDGV